MGSEQLVSDHPLYDERFRTFLAFYRANRKLFKHLNMRKENNP